MSFERDEHDDDEQVDEERHRRRDRHRERDHEVRERELAQQRRARDERRHREPGRVDEEDPEDDPDQQVERVVLEADVELEEAAEDGVEHREHRERLRDRPDVAERGLRVLELVLGARDDAEDAQLLRRGCMRRALRLATAASAALMAA